MDISNSAQNAEPKPSVEPTGLMFATWPAGACGDTRQPTTWASTWRRASAASPSHRT